ncbi:hypothetical protein MASR2M79_21920 [Aminivibrio sp.]
MIREIHKNTVQSMEAGRSEKELERLEKVNHKRVERVMKKEEAPIEGGEKVQGDDEFKPCTAGGRKHPESGLQRRKPVGRWSPTSPTSGLTRGGCIWELYSYLVYGH